MRSESILQGGGLLAPLETKGFTWEGESKPEQLWTLVHSSGPSSLPPRRQPAVAESDPWCAKARNGCKGAAEVGGTLPLPFTKTTPHVGTLPLFSCHTPPLGSIPESSTNPSITKSQALWSTTQAGFLFLLSVKLGK